MFVRQFKHFTPKPDLEALATGLLGPLTKLAPKGAFYAMKVEKDDA